MCGLHSLFRRQRGVGGGSFSRESGSVSTRGVARTPEGDCSWQGSGVAGVSMNRGGSGSLLPEGNGGHVLWSCAAPLRAAVHGVIPHAPFSFVDTRDIVDKL